MSKSPRGQQIQCSKLIKEWFPKEDILEFVLAGWAGTGKSFMIEHIIDVLNLNPDSGEVIFATFMGKASLVVTRKAGGKYTCYTLHKTLYYAKKDPRSGKVTFHPKTAEHFVGVKLIIVDEASMITKELLRILRTLKIKILFIGDHGQLPPIGEADREMYNRLKYRPDFVLTEIQRQAEGNPIIALATQIRNDEKINIGKYGEGVLIIPKSQIMKYSSSLINADQVLCGLNATRHRYNGNIRDLLGIKSQDPVNGDKLICLRNNWNRGIEDYALVNGMVGFIDNVKSINKYFNYDFRPDFLNDHVNVYSMQEEIHGKYVDYQSLTRQEKDMLDSFNYGYAITTHKAQGSEWDKVFGINETFKGNEAGIHGYNKEWLYTLCTRPAEKLILAV